MGESDPKGKYHQEKEALILFLAIEKNLNSPP